MTEMRSGSHHQNYSGRRFSAGQLADILLAELETPRPGDQVACYRLRRWDHIVLGRSPMECEVVCKRFHPLTWPMFRHEHWVGDLRHGEWVRSED